VATNGRREEAVIFIKKISSAEQRPNLFQQYEYWKEADAKNMQLSAELQAKAQTCRGRLRSEAIRRSARSETFSINQFALFWKVESDRACLDRCAAKSLKMHFTGLATLS
jgi:predicted alpha-1,6-mannanase (GH76 family)